MHPCPSLAYTSTSDGFAGTSAASNSLQAAAIHSAKPHTKHHILPETHPGKKAAQRGGLSTPSSCPRSWLLPGLSTLSASARSAKPAARQASLCACQGHTHSQGAALPLCKAKRDAVLTWSNMGHPTIGARKEACCPASVSCSSGPLALKAHSRSLLPMQPSLTCNCACDQSVRLTAMHTTAVHAQAPSAAALPAHARQLHAWHWHPLP